MSFMFTSGSVDISSPMIVECPRLMLFMQWICITNEKFWAFETPNLAMRLIPILLTFSLVGDIVVSLWCNNTLNDYNLLFAVEADTISISQAQILPVGKNSLFSMFYMALVFILWEIFFLDITLMDTSEVSFVKCTFFCDYIIFMTTFVSVPLETWNLF